MLAVCCWTKSITFHTVSQESAFGLPEAPVFRPTLEEFEDPIAYITKIRPIGEAAGICRIIPPPEWERKVFFKNVDLREFRFVTKAQSIHRMFNRNGPNVTFLSHLKKFMRNVQQQNFNQLPVVDGQPLDLYRFYLVTESLGGLTNVRTIKPSLSPNFGWGN